MVAVFIIVLGLGACSEHAPTAIDRQNARVMGSEKRINELIYIGMSYDDFKKVMPNRLWTSAVFGPNCLAVHSLTHRIRVGLVDGKVVSVLKEP